MKKSNLFVILIVVLTLISCGNVDQCLRTSYLPVVNDSIGALSPRAQAYFKNYAFPRGVVPVLQTVDSIPATELGTYAEDVFDDIADVSPDAYAFEKYGLLILVSNRPELIQVRVGSEYSTFLSMKGATAGYGYLQMQKGISEKGIEKSFPLFVDCASNEVKQYQNLSWFQLLRAKGIIGFISEFLSDWGTPSDTLFNQIYFRPALVALTFCNSILNSWFLSLLVIIFAIWGVRALLAYWLEKKLSKSVEREYAVLLVYAFKKLFAFIVSLPTLASFTMLANSRMEDYLAMKAMHIPFLELVDWSDSINNVVAPIWMIAIGAIFLYLRHIIREDGYLFFAVLPADIQRKIYCHSERVQTEAKMLLKGGLLRRKIYSSLISDVSGTSVPDTVYMSNNEEFEDFNKAFFYNEESYLFKTSPYTAISMNDHREMLFYVTVFILGATLICPTPMVMYFVAICLASIVWRLRTFYKNNKEFKAPQKVLNQGARAFFKANLKSYVCFVLLLFAMMFFQPLKSVEVKDNIETTVIKAETITGRYFVKQAGEGLNLQGGATAKIDSIGNDSYYLYVYSEYLTKRYELKYDEQTSLFQSTDIGNGTLEYDKEINKITLKFSTGWIFTK